MARIRRQATARYVLRELEHCKRETQELQVTESPKKVHVEHIYPQTPRGDQRLPNHDAIVVRLGNLTLLARPLNQSIGNAPFVEKKGVYQQSDLLLTKELTQYEEWNAETIAERQERMSELASQIWSLP